MPVDGAALTVALISDVFFSAGRRDRLDSALRDARARGADLASLPELPHHRREGRAGAKR